MKKQEVTTVYKLDLEIISGLSSEINAISKLLAVAIKNKQVDEYDSDKILKNISSLSIDITNKVGELCFEMED
ncbi:MULTISPECIES: hypothetical protein [Fructobacillus]|jgi:hypothetical protein|uniref:Uncharacterized protein n=1 Tax=Fructobacillus evanidus TaxID=3064281 RepID=A0ABM9MRV3_9LACO|nr:unnamed protein product [Fructobacillus sp. LMG 32999]CAK1247278.1 unnamed protein product [Fructobacillus tropaeoli]CAK1249335.1 unnamed protein product [Fructobacillus cardui]CAK1234997.1 unnamed protein product [Fructobacillus sp. LMG 32999]CAK1235591.1 unnamed protein product [Fructobacillus sp. LMG 32999]